MSIDYTVPAASTVVPVPDTSECVRMLPVTVLQKWPPVMGLDMRDESAHPVSLLTLVENRLIDAAVLVELAKTALNHEPPAALSQEIARVALEPPARARQALRNVYHGYGRDGEGLEQDAAFAGIASLLRSSLIVWVRTEKAPGAREVMKLAYKVPMRERLFLGKAIAAQLGWQPIVVWVELPHIGNAASYHAHVATVEAIEIQEAGVRASSQAGTSVQVEAHQQIVRNHAHFYVSGTLRAGGGLLWLSGRFQRADYLWGPFAATALTAVLLWGFWGCGADAAKHESEATVAVLLLVPAVAVAVLARPAVILLGREHLGGVRAMLGIAALSAVAAAVAVLLVAPNTLRSYWLALAIIATLMTAGTAAALRR